MFCKNCGKELKEGAKFCAACGAQMIDEKSVPAEDSAVESLQGQVDENFLRYIKISFSIHLEA